MTSRVLLELIALRRPVTLAVLALRLGVSPTRISQALTALGGRRGGLVENTKWKTWRARRLVLALSDALVESLSGEAIR